MFSKYPTIPPPEIWEEVKDITLRGLGKLRKGTWYKIETAEKILKEYLQDEIRHYRHYFPYGGEIRRALIELTVESEIFGGKIVYRKGKIKIKT